MLKVNIHTLRSIIDSLNTEDRDSIAGFLVKSKINLVPGNPRGYMLEFKTPEEETLFRLKYAHIL